jgi:hypothetical protein
MDMRTDARSSMRNDCHRAPGTMLLLFVCVLIAVVAVGCRQSFKLSILHPEAVPNEIREQVMPMKKEVVWRVFERTDEYEFVAFTYVVERESQKYDLYEVQARWLDEGGAIVDSCAGSGDARLRFSSSTSSGSGMSADGKTVFSLYAWGAAHDPAVTAVVGISDNGTRVEAEVLHGFWALHIAPAEQHELWSSLTATGADGSVRHRYQLPK